MQAIDLDRVRFDSAQAPRAGRAAPPANGLVAGRSRLKPGFWNGLVGAVDAGAALAFLWVAPLVAGAAPLLRLTLIEAAPLFAAALALYLPGAAGRRGEASLAPLCGGAALAVLILLTFGAFEANAPAFALLAAGASVLARGVRDDALRRRRRQGAVRETAVLVGATEAAERFLARNAAAGGEGVDVVAVFDDRLARAPKALGGAPVFGDVDALLAWEELPHIDQIVIAVAPSAEARLKELVSRLRVAPNRISLLLDFAHLSPEPVRIGAVAGAPAAQLAGPTVMGGAAKRVLDVAIAGAMLVLLTPLMALMAAAIRLDSPGPAIFRQQRQGLNGRPFQILKFRTMRHPPAPGRLEQVRPNDPRVTRIGGFLRRTSLDELPQLWNVLVGDMSLVGPRPHAPGMRVGATPCEAIAPRYMHRCRAKPGLTGWAQINGSRGPLHSAEDVSERIALDLDYVERQSPWLDLLIMLRTAPALLGDRLRTR